MFVVVTEHQPADEDLKIANLDKIHGAYTRLFAGSGVYLDRPPFDLATELLLEANPDGHDDIHARGKIRTFLLKPPRV